MPPLRGVGGDTVKAIDEQLSTLADCVAALEGGKGVARDLFALASHVSTDLEDARRQDMRRGQNVCMKMLDYSNEVTAANWEQMEMRMRNDRARIARLLAASDLWTGSYADAVALITPPAVEG